MGGVERLAGELLRKEWGWKSVNHSVKEGGKITYDPIWLQDR